MRKSIISLIILCSWSTLASAATTADLASGAPDRYVVVPGDTLWSIASRYLKSPWKWHELWRMNRAQIKNPNRIYPGDVIVLDRSAADVRLQLLKSDTIKLSPQALTSDLAAEPVPTIPIADIEPFLSKPLVIAQDQLVAAPRIVRTQEDRVALGAGNIAYAQGITQDQGDYWQIFRAGPVLVDPDTQESLGYQAIYLGEAKVAKYGAVSTLEIVKSPLEIYAGDYLLPSPRQDLLENYLPHAPDKKIDARIIAAYGGLFEVGNNAIVAISKGARDGVEVGHVFAIYRNLNASTYRLRESALYGRTGLIYDEKNPRTNYHNTPLATRDSPLYGRVGPMGYKYRNDKTRLPAPPLPDERYGLLMVFRVFDRASYALVMNADRQVHVLDLATNP
ncbi:MAG TPA: LysM domain-containing protein [Burkholderiales bacterium]|nr:LysM domain-containing protein [Burkholderiales bacterium]